MRSLRLSFPPALATLLREILNPEPDFERIGKVIRTDPALTANVIALVNSPFYGLSRKILDLKHAAVILGTRELLKIILGISLVETSRLDGKLEPHITQLWRTTIWSATAAQTLAEHHCPEQTDQAFLSALLKDIALLLPAESLAEHAPGAREKHEDQPCGADHADAGCRLLGDINLPREMLDAVAAHHDLARIRDHPPLTQCVILATAWAETELDPRTDPLARINFKYALQEQLAAPGPAIETFRKTILRRFTSLTRLLHLDDPVFDTRLLTLSVDKIQRIFFLSMDLAGAVGGLESLARIIQKHLHFQWNLRAWELGLRWPRERQWSLFRCHLGEILHETQTYVPFQDLTWTYSSRCFVLAAGGRTWGEIRIPEKFLNQEILDQLGYYTRFVSQALEQYSLRTAILEDKARILDRLPIGVAWLNASGRVMDANASLRRMLGVDVVQGKDLYAALNSNGLVRAEAPWRSFIEHTEQNSMSSLLCPAAMSPDISTPCLYLSAHKISDGKRRDILVLLEDIKDIAELQSQLLKQRDFLRGLINAMRDVILTTDDQGRITFTSSQLPPDLLGRDLFAVTKPASDFAGSWDANLLDKLTAPQEVILFPGGGPAIPLDLLFSPLPPQADGSREFLIVGRDLSSIRRLEEKLRQQAMFDELTGLFNHRHFMEILDRETSRARRVRRPLSLIFFDLDRFKQINDTQGHQAGDEILRGVGNILRKTGRKGVDFPARYGGDEFAVLANETDEQQVRHLAERIRAAVRERFSKVIDLSIGLAQFLPEEAQEDFLKRADRASYAAKQAGGGRIVAG